MTKRYYVEDDGFSRMIRDNTLTEDKHEGTMYSAEDACCKLNEQDQQIQQIKSIMDNELKNAFENRVKHDDYAEDPERAEYFKGYHCGVSDLTKKIMEVLFK